MQFSSILLSSLLATVAHSATIQGQVNFPYNITSKDVENTNIEIQQVGAKTSSNSLISSRVFLQSNSAFMFKDVKDGEYILSLDSIDFKFTPSKVKISVQQDQVKTYLYEVGSSYQQSKIAVHHPLQYRLSGKDPQRIYGAKPSNGLLDVEPIKTIVNSPLYLTMVVGLISLFLLPMIWEMIDPEVAAAAKKYREGNESNSTSTSTATAADDKEIEEDNAATEGNEKENVADEKRELIEEKKEQASKKSTLKNKKRKS
ncbi:hypothetical protein WICPIJ_004398 [Wickerhamomyces pijperi]|uniref:Protein SOP4 n=1 Tax=Wickerhamomyces pijperi TaxID=599730 RepID=A0A9P8Q7U6_WICPI|nr:hypothetical protein WICPIJ_004398 [Wickerhamomyces pijperi]